MRRLLPLLLALIACDPLAKPDAGDPDRPPCAGATIAQGRASADPQVWRGVVSAPASPQARRSPLDLLIPSAHAVPLPGEQPVAGAKVSADGGAGAVSDARGRFCLRLDAAPLPQLTAALPGGATLRGITTAGVPADINIQTEAMHRALAAANLPVATLSSAQRLNLLTIADTALGLMRGEQAPVTALEPAIVASQDALEADLRWQAAVARLKAARR
jgi:microcystin-dependent protein